MNNWLELFCLYAAVFTKHGLALKRFPSIRVFDLAWYRVNGNPDYRAPSRKWSNHSMPSVFFWIFVECLKLYMQNNVKKKGKKRPNTLILRLNLKNFNAKRLTTASGRQLIAPIGAVPLAVTKPAFWNAGIRAGAAEQSWSTSHRAWKKKTEADTKKISQKKKKNKNHWDEPPQKLCTHTWLLLRRPPRVPPPPPPTILQLPSQT